MLNHFFKSRNLIKALQNSFIYSSANSIATLINFVAFIYYSRVLGPVDYGVYNIVVSFISVVGIFSFSGINKVILREASLDESKSTEVYNDSYGIRLVFIILALTVCFISLAFTGYEREINILISIFSFSILIQSFNQSLNALFQARLKYRLTSVFVIAEAIFLFGLAILLIEAGLGVLAIIISQMLVPAISSLAKYKYLNVRHDFRIKLNTHFDRKYFSQGFNFSLLNNLNVLSSRIDIFMLSLLTTEYLVGIYAVAFNLVSKLGVLRNSVILSIFPVTAKKINSEGIRGTTLIFYSLLFGIPVLFIAYLLGFFAEDLIVLVLGKNFKSSAEFLVILIYRVGLDFMILPIGVALQASYNERVNLIFAATRAVLNISFNLVFFNIWGVIGIAYSTLTTTLIVSVFILVYGYSRLKKLNLIR